MEVDDEKFNAHAVGYTAVRSLEFRSDRLTGRCDVDLLLANVDAEEASMGGAVPTIFFEFADVSELALQHFGGGLTQLLCLRARDISADQQDMVRFIVEDLEMGAISFRCRAICARRLDGSVQPGGEPPF